MTKPRTFATFLSMGCEPPRSTNFVTAMDTNQTRSLCAVSTSGTVGSMPRRPRENAAVEIHGVAAVRPQVGRDLGAARAAAARADDRPVLRDLVQPRGNLGHRNVAGRETGTGDGELARLAHVENAGRLPRVQYGLQLLDGHERTLRRASVTIESPSHAGRISQRTLHRFQPRRGALRVRGGPHPSGPPEGRGDPPRRGRTAAQDRPSPREPEPRRPLGGALPPPSRRPQDRAQGGRSGRQGAEGVGRRSRRASARPSSCARPPACGRRSTSSRPRWSSRSGSPGPRPTSRPPRRSTSSSSTPARCCAGAARSPSRRTRASFPRRSTSPLGAGAVIPPWNFPNAILTGMTSAALVAGNAVVLKPASDTPLIAWRVFTLLEEAGVPAGALNYLPGPGSEVGDLLVEHAQTRFISFTGSKAGRARRSTRRRPRSRRASAGSSASSSRWAARTSSSSTRTRTSTSPSRRSSRRRSDSRARSARRARARSSTGGSTGASWTPSSRGPRSSRRGRRAIRKNFMGPVASERQFKTVTDYIKVGRRESKLGDGRHVARTRRNFVAPTVFYDVKPTGAHLPGGDLRAGPRHHRGEGLRDARSRSRTRASTASRARTSAATAAASLEAKKRLHCGNLYINRKCTGALVGVHPFGGFDMSGTDSKAGGRDYLGLFLQAKSISEKL